MQCSDWATNALGSTSICPNDFLWPWFLWIAVITCWSLTNHFLNLVMWGLVSICLTQILKDNLICKSFKKEFFLDGRLRALPRYLLILIRILFWYIPGCQCMFVSEYLLVPRSIKLSADQESAMTILAVSCCVVQQRAGTAPHLNRNVQSECVPQNPCMTMHRILEHVLMAQSYASLLRIKSHCHQPGDFAAAGFSPGLDCNRTYF